MPQVDIPDRSPGGAAPSVVAGAGDWSAAADEELSLARIVHLLRTVVLRRWKLVVAVWVTVLVPVLVYAVTAVPTYTAHGAVQVSEVGSPLGTNPLADLMGAGSQAQVQTEVEILRRREFLVDVLQDLKLHVADPNESWLVTLDMAVALAGESPVDPRLLAIRRALSRVHVRDDRFTPLRVVVEAVSPAEGRIRTVESADPVEVRFRPGDPVEIDGVRLLFSTMPLAPGERFEVEILPEGALLEDYRDRIHVASLGTIREPTNIVQISVESTDRETARAIVQKMMDRYLQKHLEWQVKSASQAAEFIDHQLEEVRKALLGAEDRLKAFAEQEHAVQLDTQAKVAIERSAELTAQRIQLEIQERTIESVLRRLQGGRPDRAEVTANFFEDPVLAAAVEALTQAEMQYETLRASLTDAHPQVQEMSRALARQKQKVAQLMRSAQRNVAHQKVQLDREIEEAMEAMSSYPDKQLRLAQLTREMEVTERLYTLLLEKREEAEILKASTTTDKRVVDAPGLPHKKTAPNRRGLVALGGLGGLLLGIAAAFGRHVLQTRLETVEAVRDEVPLPVYGTLPLVAGGASKRPMDPAELWSAPHDPGVEAFRALAVAVSLLPDAQNGGRLLTIASAQPGEGKSTVASNLAVALARMGKRVLLMDLDLRKPVQHRIWRLPRAPGYTDLLARGAEASEASALARDVEEAEHLRVLAAGTKIPDTVAAVMAPKIARFFEGLRAAYDYVILDGPPAFVAEASALASRADLTLLVVRPGVIERANLRHAVEALARGDARCGLVLNAVGRRNTEHYYGGGYYYYGTKYGEDEAASRTTGDAGKKIA